MRTLVRNSYTPKLRDFCNMIVVDNDNQTQYIFDSDGVWTTYTSKNQEGASIAYVTSSINSMKNILEQYADDGDASTLALSKTYTDTKLAEYAKTTYVDTQDAATLQAAKDYTDAHSGQGGGVSQQYVDSHDASTLQSAKNYADQMANAAIAAADQHSAAGDATTLQTAKDYADGKDATNLQAAKDYADTQIAAANVPVFTMSTTDIGEGAPLAANNFWCVYEENQ